MHDDHNNIKRNNKILLFLCAFALVGPFALKYFSMNLDLSTVAQAFDISTFTEDAEEQLIETAQTKSVKNENSTHTNSSKEDEEYIARELAKIEQLKKSIKKLKEENQQISEIAARNEKSLIKKSEKQIATPIKVKATTEKNQSTHLVHGIDWKSPPKVSGNYKAKKLPVATQKTAKILAPVQSTNSQKLSLKDEFLLKQKKAKKGFVEKKEIANSRKTAPSFKEKPSPKIGINENNSFGNTLGMSFSKVSENLYVGTTEVTQKQWKSLMGNNPSEIKGDNLPVTNISLAEAIEFVKKLNYSEKTAKYKLPTEKEWMLASVNNNKSKKILLEKAWVPKNSDGKIKEVALKKPNQFNAYDMLGNVWEWCIDDFYTGETNLKNNKKYVVRVIKGGSFKSDTMKANTQYKGKMPGQRKTDYVGFRVFAKI
jgi:hypothetical protein